MKKNESYPSYFPFPYEVEAGKIYKWCGCGQSKSQPLCDQENCGEQCKIYRAITTETVLFCGCKQTKEPPFCDGTHGLLLMQKREKKS